MQIDYRQTARQTEGEEGDVFRRELGAAEEWSYLHGCSEEPGVHGMPLDIYDVSSHAEDLRAEVFTGEGGKTTNEVAALQAEIVRQKGFKRHTLYRAVRAEKRVRALLQIADTLRDLFNGDYDADALIACEKKLETIKKDITSRATNGAAPLHA